SARTSHLPRAPRPCRHPARRAALHRPTTGGSSMSRTAREFALAAALLLLACAGRAPAQTAVFSSYCPPMVSDYAPPVSYYSAPVVSYYTPPAVSYYAPATVSYYAPLTTSYYAAPVVSYYAPPVVSYYSAPVGVATTTRYGVFGRPRWTTTYYYP